MVSKHRRFRHHFCLYKLNSLYKEPSLPESPIHDLSVTDSIQQQFPLIDYEMKEYRHPAVAAHLQIISRNI